MITVAPIPPVPTEPQWKDMAIELAQALSVLPCVCVKRANSWPPMKEGRPDVECRRCRVLAKHYALLNAVPMT